MQREGDPNGKGGGPLEVPGAWPALLMPDVRCAMCDVRCPMCDVRCQMPDVRRLMPVPNAGCRMPEPDAGYPMCDAGPGVGMRRSGNNRADPLESGRTRQPRSLSRFLDRAARTFVSKWPPSFEGCVWAASGRLGTEAEQSGEGRKCCASGEDVQCAGIGGCL
jgi:hypothetical protein